MTNYLNFSLFSIASTRVVRNHPREKHNFKQNRTTELRTQNVDAEWSERVFNNVVLFIDDYVLA